MLWFEKSIFKLLDVFVLKIFAQLAQIFKTNMSKQSRPTPLKVETIQLNTLWVQWKIISQYVQGNQQLTPEV